MAERPIDAILRKQSQAKVAETTAAINSKIYGPGDVTPEGFRIPTEEEAQVRLSEVMDRGQTVSRLDVKLPDYLVGQWVPKDAAEISRLRALGYQIDKDYSVENDLHGNGVVGDCVFMIAPKVVREVYDKQMKAQYIQAHHPKQKQQSEDRMVERDIRELGLAPINTSTTSKVDNESLAQLVSELPLG